MKHLRNKLMIPVILSVVAACAGTGWVAVKTFLEDKRNYILELNSRAVPTIAASIGRHLDTLESQFALFDEVLATSRTSKDAARLLQSSFRGMRCIEQLAVSDASGLLVHLRSASSQSGGEPIESP